MAKTEALTPREDLFVRAYLGNGRDKNSAAKAAGYKGNLSSVSKRLLDKPRVQACIKELEAEYEALGRITPDRIMVEISKIAFFDFSEVMAVLTKDGGTDPEKWSTDARAAVSSVKVTRTFTKGGDVRVVTEFKTWDRLKALRMLGESAGLFDDLNTGRATLKTYGIEIEKIDGAWTVVS